MKKLKGLYTLVMLFATSTLVAQSFEGVINMTTTNSEMKEEASVVWYLKGDRSRMDIKSTADGHNSEYSIIVDEKGMHMVAEGYVTEVPQVAMKVDNAAQTLLSEEKDVKMNGYNCTKAVYFDGANQTIYWLTNDMDISFDDIPFVVKRNMPKIKSTGFPIKMEKRDAKGNLILSQDVSSVTPASVKESRFERN